MDKFAKHVLGHDVAPSGPSTAPLVHPPPPPPPRRTSTVLSSGTQISITISTPAHLTCHCCMTPVSRMHKLSFSMRRTILNPLYCKNCNRTILLLGGPKLGPSSRMSTGPLSHGSDEAEASISHDLAPTTLRRPANTHSYTESSIQNVSQGRTAEPQSYYDEEEDERPVPEIYTAPLDNNKSFSNPPTNHINPPRRRMFTRIAHKSLKLLVNGLPRRWRARLEGVTERVEKVATTVHDTVKIKGKQPVREIKDNDMPGAPATPGMFSYASSPSPTPRCCLQCGNEACRCQNYAATRSIRSAVSPPLRPTEPSNMSQVLLGLKDLKDDVKSYLRWSMTSSDIFSSHAAGDMDNGRHRSSPTPGPSTYLTPPPPHQPHHTAAGPAAPAIVYHQASGVDSAVQMSPRTSHSFAEGT